MRRSLSLRFMWASLPLPERARRAARAGFDSVELWDWRGEDLEGLAAVCGDEGIAIAGFFGHSHGGLRDPAQRDEVLAGLAESLAVAESVGARQLHMFSDDIGPDSTIRKPPALTREAQRRSVIEGLRECLDLVAGAPTELVLEAINTVYVPGYFLAETGDALSVAREIDHPQLRIFFDCYHQQLVGGRLIDNLLDALPYVASVHVADVPGRGQPGTGEINFHSIWRVLAEQGYDAQLTFEVAPQGSEEEAVAAIKEVFPFP